VKTSPHSHRSKRVELRGTLQLQEHEQELKRALDFSLDTTRNTVNSCSWRRSHNAESRMEHAAVAKQSSLVDETGIEPATSSLRTVGKIS
jgi:hypothetical protein